jgi:hypothetical protein
MGRAGRAFNRWAADGTHPTGTCSDDGAIAFDLGRLQNGATTRTVGVGLPELLAASVDVVSASVGGIACGELPDRLPN